MRRWLANRLESWSYTLRDWADRVRPPWRRPPGPETQLERITREASAAATQRMAESIYREDWDRLAAKPHRIGETLRIRLPNDYEVKR